MSDISVKSDTSAISSLCSSVGKSIRFETSFNNKSASLKEESTGSSPSSATESKLSEKSSPSGKSKELSKGRLKSESSSISIEGKSVSNS